MLETLIVAIAVFGSALYPTGEVARQPYEIIPYTARHGLPALMGALLLGAVFAKVISTASNYLFSPATNLINDVFVRYIAPDASNKRVLIVSRLAVVLLGCWALYQAIYAPSILEKMLWAYTIYSAALTPVVLAAFYSKRVTAWGAVAAIAAGTVVTLAWDLPGVKALFPPILADRDAIFPALFVAVAATHFVSPFTPGSPRPNSSRKRIPYCQSATQPCRANRPKLILGSARCKRAPAGLKFSTRALEDNYPFSFRACRARTPNCSPSSKPMPTATRSRSARPPPCAAGARWLGVTSVEEGIAARALCPDARILVIGGSLSRSGRRRRPPQSHSRRLGAVAVSTSLKPPRAPRASALLPFPSILKSTPA